MAYLQIETNLVTTDLESTIQVDKPKTNGTDNPWERSPNLLIKA
jgi:hypothetical protein